MYAKNVWTLENVKKNTKKQQFRVSNPKENFGYILDNGSFGNLIVNIHLDEQFPLHFPSSTINAIDPCVKTFKNVNVSLLKCGHHLTWYNEMFQFRLCNQISRCSRFVISNNQPQNIDKANIGLNPLLIKASIYSNKGFRSKICLENMY